MANAFNTFSMADSMQNRSTARGGSTNARYPTIPTVSSKTGNMTADINKNTSPLKPAAPSAPMITENINRQYFDKEKTRQGMVSTLLGRDVNLNSNVRRRNELSSLIG